MGWFNIGKQEEATTTNLPSIQQTEVLNVNSSPSVAPVKRENAMGVSPGDKKDPFFVRIDKFNEGKKNLFEIEKKLQDMENILAKLGETKQKEDEEISSWKKDMGVIRNYLESINQSVFSKL